MFFKLFDAMSKEMFTEINIIFLHTNPLDQVVSDHRDKFLKGTVRLIFLSIDCYTTDVSFF